MKLESIWADEARVIVVRRMLKADGWRVAPLDDFLGSVTQQQ